MDKTSIKELNALLKGEYMAIDAYETYIQNIDDGNLKRELQQIQQDHKLHTIMVSERIQRLGGRPSAGVGLGGKVAEAFNNIKHMRMHDAVTLLKNAYDGEDSGIKMATEIVKGDLDNGSLELVKDILNDDRAHLDTLNSLIQSTGGLK